MMLAADIIQSAFKISLLSVVVAEWEYWNSIQYLSNKYPSISVEPAQNGIPNKWTNNRRALNEAGGDGSETEQCGVRKSEFRIVKGTRAPEGFWPWLVALGYRDHSNGNEPSFQCSGALIASDYKSFLILVTAAHCVHQRPELYLARMGTNDLVGSPGQDWPVKEVIIHAGYKAETNENDIALVKLKMHAKTTRSVQLLCLPPRENISLNGSKAWIAGWGATSYGGPSSRDLMQLAVSVVDSSVCRKAYSVFGNAATAVMTDAQVLCAAADPGKDACQGDSGGPLMWESQGKFYLIGVISFGYKCAEPNFPGVYTSVMSFLPWVKRQLRQLSA